MLYILPKVNLCNIKYDEIPYTNRYNSLQYYLNTFLLTDDIEKNIFQISKYKPTNDYFFVILELLIINKIHIDTKINYLGSDACIEAISWLKQNNILNTCKPPQLLICDIDLFKNQIEYCLENQVIGGMCFLKITDTLLLENIQLLYILCSCYNSVHIYKPQSIKNTSLVKFIICNDLKKKINIENYKNINIPYYFNTKINEINFTYGQMHIENLQYNDEKNEKWVLWCSNFFIPV
jgi:hypothetical protein